MRIRVLLAVTVVCIGVAEMRGLRANQQAASVAVAALLAEADKLSLLLKTEESKAKVDEALAVATTTNDRIGIAMSYRAMGLTLTRVGRHAPAIPWYEKALAEFEGLRNAEGIAQALNGLTKAFSAVGDKAKASEYGGRAIQLLDGESSDRIRIALLGAAIESGIDPKRSEAWNEEQLAAANRLGDDLARARALSRRGARQFETGNYVAARASYELAIEALGEGRDIESLAANYLNLGRVFRAHGDYAGALQRYQKAIDLLAPTTERYTFVEATNAKAVALGQLGRGEEALTTYREGLVLARASGNQVLIDFMEGNLAGGLLTVGRYEEAVPVLERVIARKPTPYIASFRYGQLGSALMKLGRFAEALPRLDEAVRLERELKLFDNLAEDLLDRARVLGSLGRPGPALADAREALSIVEQIRLTLLPSDFFKRGYNGRVDRAHSFIVDLLSRESQQKEALEVAEKGRSRAFLDLLAARESSAASLTLRGLDAPPSTAGRPDLTSDTIAKPLDYAGIAAVAARLNATIVSYWVEETAVLIWTVPPSGTPTHVRVPVARERLAAQVAKTTALFRASPGEAAGRGADTNQDLTAVPMRGVGVLALSRDDKASWRELYRSLIAPVVARLPRNSRLVIVPHGPLFHLSFAALQNGAGRYLIEDFELSYAPSISVLDFTSRRQQVVNGNISSAWAVVGNPSTLPSVGNRPLPPLPGAAEEINVIAGLAPKGRAVLRLEGLRATEAEVARSIETAHPSVLHFATHGFVFDDAKQPPFLALNRRGSEPGDDGRLTLDEVYGLRLATDLVVLSACRSGSGQISSDGVIGLTRGFLYAGSPSVMATFWDVVDEATGSLISAFYRNYVKTHAKGASLRTAQLALLKDLRAGKVIVTASGRRITLPEHPLLWAAFFLSGEP